MQLPKFTVTFDDGEAVEVESTSRDLYRLEKLGVDLQTVGPMAGAYAMAHTAMLRLKRQDRLDIQNEIPDTAEALADVADLSTDDEDPEGEGSGQEATPG